MRNLFIVLWMLLCSIASATAQVSLGVGLPGISIGINMPVYPEFVRVPGYPVYYAPRVSSNYFFYDGMYWVYQRDNWYASSWYNGPWGLVGPEAVPLFVLRIPVRYYRQPPAYFRGWRSDAPPRWGEHWGNSWEQSRSGWDNWNRSSVPAPAPLPVYQRQYSGSRYPHVEQQQVLHGKNYRYQPQDAVVQQHYQAQRAQSAPARSQPQDQRAASRPSPPQQSASPAPRARPPQTNPAPNAQHEQQAPKVQSQGQQAAADKAPPKQASPAAQHQSQQQPAVAQREQKAPKSQDQDKGSQGKGSAKEPKQGHDKGDKQGG